MAVRDETDVRIAVVGNVDSGKSTLVGVLTKGIADDGRGYARTKVFNFNHEA
jgi:GTPase|tara:strand:+ start:343 stop:498 length:156 start_codon:yes stop_codon:yes gene_type:complete